MLTLISGATIVNEDRKLCGSLLIEDDRIAEIYEGDMTPRGHYDRKVDAAGCFVLPGVIDDHVHFREPGLTSKADIESESRAAAFGGVTSYFDMPNTVPQTTTLAALEEKFRIAASHSHVNYSFFFGATNDNMRLADRLDKSRIPAVIEEYNKSAANNLDSGKSERKAIQKLISRTEKEIENLVSVIASSGSVAMAAGLEKKEADLVRLINQLDGMNRQSTELHVDNEQLIRVFNHGRELLLSGKLPKLKKLINLYVERIDIYPDVVNVTLNIMGSMLSQSDNRGLAELSRISPEGLEISDSVSREHIKKF